MFPVSLVCGNTMLLKPSERDPGATMMLMELCCEAGFPAGTVNVIHGQHDAVNFICDHPAIRAISFVGSDFVGKHIYDRGSKNGKRVQANMVWEIGLVAGGRIETADVMPGRQESRGYHARRAQGGHCESAGRGGVRGCRATLYGAEHGRVRGGDATMDTRRCGPRETAEGVGGDSRWGRSRAGDQQAVEGAHLFTGRVRQAGGSDDRA